MSGPAECLHWDHCDCEACVAECDKALAAAPLRADIPLETYWTDRTAALAEALHGPLSTQLAALMHQRDGHKRVIGYRGGGETLRGDDLCDFHADRIVTEWLGADAKDALLYLREHGWTLERDATVDSA